MIFVIFIILIIKIITKSCECYLGDAHLTKILFILAKYISSYIDFAVTLVGGAGAHEGNVFVNGKPVCGSEQRPENAMVICRFLKKDQNNLSLIYSFTRMLGYKRGTDNNGSLFGSINSTFGIGPVYCQGHETDIIKDCPHSAHTRNCAHHEALGVSCSSSKFPFTDGQYFDFFYCKIAVDCGTDIEENIEYSGNGGLLETLKNVPNQDTCAQNCANHKECRFWVFHKSGQFPNNCELKSSFSAAIIYDFTNSGVRPCP